MLPVVLQKYSPNQSHEVSEFSEEHNLVAAVVRQALADLNNHKLHVQQSAFWWLFVDAREAVMSLAWCCEVLDCDVREVRLHAEAENRTLCWGLAAWYATGYAFEPQEPVLNPDRLVCA